MTIVEFLTARLDEDEADLDNEPYDACYRDLRFGAADIAAKRRILERWQYRWQEAGDATEQRMHSMFASQATGLGNAVYLLAEVYSNHPDYREEWRP